VIEGAIFLKFTNGAIEIGVCGRDCGKSKKRVFEHRK